jgi:hypothetical protein
MNDYMACDLCPVHLVVQNRRASCRLIGSPSSHLVLARYHKSVSRTINILYLRKAMGSYSVTVNEVSTPNGYQGTMSGKKLLPQGCVGSYHLTPRSHESIGLVSFLEQPSCLP